MCTGNYVCLTYLPDSLSSEIEISETDESPKVATKIKHLIKKEFLSMYSI